MNNNVVTYRGASVEATEVNQIRSNQLQQQQGSRLVIDRGLEGVVASGKSKSNHAVQYRGAKAVMSV